MSSRPVPNAPASQSPPVRITVPTYAGTTSWQVDGHRHYLTLRDDGGSCRVATVVDLSAPGAFYEEGTTLNHSFSFIYNHRRKIPQLMAGKEQNQHRQILLSHEEFASLSDSASLPEGVCSDVDRSREGRATSGVQVNSQGRISTGGPSR